MAKKLMSFMVPIAPSKNHTHGINIRARHGKRVYLTPRARNYLKAVEDLTRKALPYGGIKPPGADHWLVVEMRHFDSARRKGSDLDNRSKLILDGIKNGIGIDDAFYLPRHMSREIVHERDQRIHITILLERKDIGNGSRKSVRRYR